jgi:hypothetical protein
MFSSSLIFSIFSSQFSNCQLLFSELYFFFIISFSSSFNSSSLPSIIHPLPCPLSSPSILEERTEGNSRILDSLHLSVQLGLVLRDFVSSLG